MLTKKEQEVLGITFGMPSAFDPFWHKKVNKKTEGTDLRKKHMMELVAQGVKISQIARAYKITRQRAHQIIKS